MEEEESDGENEIGVEDQIGQKVLSTLQTLNDLEKFVKKGGTTNLSKINKSL